MILNKFGKALAIGSAVMIFVGLDTCANRSFRPKPKIEKPNIDTTSIDIEGRKYYILHSKSGDIEVINTTLEKNFIEN